MSYSLKPIVLLIVLCSTTLLGVGLKKDRDKRPFIKGHYYTYDGSRVDGLLRHKPAIFSATGSWASYLQFKKTMDSSPEKLTTTEASSFVMGEDSFGIVKNIKINQVQGKYEIDFAQVSIVGPMSLYFHKSSSSDGVNYFYHSKWILSNDGENFLCIYKGIKKQRNDLAELFSATPRLKTRILNKELDKDYKTGFKGLLRFINKYNEELEE
ncbi:MAG: hypothetical protein CL840_16100 [Crocinitomicaceae bacterium]|nr:hypothetical protein [Crocinitomicaceae bacterium]|tara:strand:+ start:12067 stop:12699 length:633 start_codon:yes stop_codon:yes gene_type:complete